MRKHTKVLKPTEAVTKTDARSTRFVSRGWSLRSQLAIYAYVRYFSEIAICNNATETDENCVSDRQPISRCQVMYVCVYELSKTKRAFRHETPILDIILELNQMNKTSDRLIFWHIIPLGLEETNKYLWFFLCSHSFQFRVIENYSSQWASKSYINLIEFIIYMLINLLLTYYWYKYL